MNNTHKIAFTFFLIVVMASALQAQSDSSYQIKKGFLGLYMSSEFTDGNFSKLNTVLTANNFPSVRSLIGISVGVTARPAAKDSYFSVEIFSFNNNASMEAPAAKKTEMSIIGVYDAWHPDLIKSRKWRLGPDIGFGAEFLQLIISERLLQSSSFSSSISSMPATSVAERKYNAGSFFLKGGLSAEAKLSMKALNLYFGTGAAYRLSANTEFREVNQTYTDSPKVSSRGLEINVRLRMEMFPRKPKREPQPFKNFY